MGQAAGGMVGTETTRQEQRRRLGCEKVRLPSVSDLRSAHLFISAETSTRIRSKRGDKQAKPPQQALPLRQDMSITRTATV